MRNTNLNQSFNKLKTEIMKDNLSEQMVNISKAGAFDALRENYSKLMAENKALKEDLKAIMDVLCDPDIVADNVQALGRIIKILSNSITNNKLYKS